MSGAPDVTLWVEILLVLGGGTALAVGAAALLGCVVKAAAGRRLLWQAATVCLAALVLGELTGAAPLFARFLKISMAPSPERPSRTSSDESSDGPSDDVPISATPAQPGKPAGAISGAGVALETRATSGEKATPSFGPAGIDAPADGSIAPPIVWTVPPRRDREEPLEAAIVLETGGAHVSDNVDGIDAINQDEPISGLWWPGIVWIAVAGPLLARALFAWTALFFLTRRRAEASASDVAARADRLARRLGLVARVRVLRASGLSGPLAAGIIRPAVVIPDGFERDYDSSQQEAMLLHELAHLRGHDPAWHVLSDLVTIALWWHPLAWWTRRELRVASEFAADEASLILDGGPDALAASLVKVGSRLVRPGFSGHARVEGSGFRSGLGRRVERLLWLSDAAPPLCPSRPNRLSRAVTAALLVAALAGSSLWLRPLAVEDDLALYRENHLQGESAMTTSLLPVWKRSLAGLTFLAVLGAGADGDEAGALQERDPLPIVDLSKDPLTAEEADPDEVSGAANPLLSQEPNKARQAEYVITEISAHRDAERKQVYLIVKGAIGADNEYANIDSVALLRRAGASGDFERVVTFKGDFEYRDYDVTAGETYAYKLTTEASRDPTAPSNIRPAKVTEQESGVVETPPIPYDFSVHVRQTIVARAQEERPTVMTRFRYWDYDKGELAGKDRGLYTEKDVVGRRYQIFRIDSENRSILVKDGIRRTRHDISSRDAPFPVELWPPVSGAAPAAEPPPPAPAPAPLPPAPALAPPPPEPLAPPAPRAPFPAQPATPMDPGTFPSALPPRASDTSSQGDLIGLATKLADAMGDARLARLRYSRISTMADRNLVSADEMDVARINLETAEQKIQLLREITRAYVRQAESQMVFLHEERDRLRKHGKANEPGLRSVESQLRAAEAMYSVLSSLASLKEPGAAEESTPTKRARR